MDNYIRVYDNVLCPEVCRDYINLIENTSKSIGTFIGKEGASIINTKIKLSEDVNISISFPNKTKELLNLFSIYLGKYEVDINSTVDVKSCEHFVGRVYRKGSGHYSQHIDCYSERTINRCLSVLLYLNDVNRGGELVFSNQDKIIQAKRGRLVIFPSYWMYKHGANIPLDVDRYMIRTFMSLINYE